MGWNPDKLSPSLRQKIIAQIHEENKARTKRICPAKSEQVPIQAVVHSEAGKVAPMVDSAKRHLVTVKMYRSILIRDEENLEYCVKELFDGLVHFGLIPDDSREAIDRNIEQFKCKRKEQRTEITIEEIEK